MAVCRQARPTRESRNQGGRWPLGQRSWALPVETNSHHGGGHAPVGEHDGWQRLRHPEAISGCQPPKAAPLTTFAAAWAGPVGADEPDNGGVTRERAGGPG